MHCVYSAVNMQSFEWKSFMRRKYIPFHSVIQTLYYATTAGACVDATPEAGRLGHGIRTK